MNSPRFDPSRLAEDHALAVEAQDEMKNIITKFVDLLKEEEQQLEVQAGERNSMHVHFRHSAFYKGQLAMFDVIYIFC